MRRFRSRTPRVRTAPKPIKFKPIALDLRGLQQAYDWMPVDKVISFRLAFEWYATNIVNLMFGKALTEEQNKDLDRATKLKALGDDSTSEGEKENAWKSALRRYEKIWAEKDLPKVDTALATTTPDKNVASLQTVLTNLNQVYRNFDVHFRLTSGEERESVEKDILLPRTELEQMVGQPPIKTALNEAINVAKVISIVTVEGQQQLDGSLFMTHLPLVLKEVGDWASTTSGISKPVGKILRTPTPKATPVPEAPSAPRIMTAPSRIRIPASDPYMIFKPDTIKAAISQRLSSHQFVPLSELRTLCGTYGVSEGMVGAAVKDLEKKANVRFEHSPDKKSIRIL